MDREKHEQIAAHAYALWQAEGQPYGRHEEHCTALRVRSQL